jgi:hypothetical protein
MADEFQLRCYSYLDRMQPQYAAFVGTITQGDLPTEGMASLYIEMAPGNEAFRMVDIAVKATEARNPLPLPGRSARSGPCRPPTPRPADY